jgi:hypothetical protein
MGLNKAATGSFFRMTVNWVFFMVESTGQKEFNI